MRGGGLKVESGEVGVNGTTISNNTVDALGAGGGVSIDGEVNVHNSTISGNVVGGGTSGSGGGIRVEPGGLVSIRFTTIVDNNALAGDALYSEGTALVGNSILQSPDRGADPCSGTLPGSNLGNVVSAPSFLNNNNATCGMSGPGDKVMVTPEELAIAALADNGGTTQTHALLQGSVAIEAFHPGTGCPVYDQRGWIRKLPICDSGAYEFNAGDPDILLIHSFEDGDAPQP